MSPSYATDRFRAGKVEADSEGHFKGVSDPRIESRRLQWRESASFVDAIDSKCVRLNAASPTEAVDLESGMY